MRSSLGGFGGFQWGLEKVMVLCMGAMDLQILREER